MTLVKLPSGLVIPKSMLTKHEIVVGIADKEESMEIEKFMPEQQRLKERKAAEKKARRAEIN